MIKVNDTILVIRNARDKVQTAQYILEQDGNTYTIRRYTGQFAGKITEQPSITIERGKAKRSVFQQAELEYNSLIKKACDKGYKKLLDLTKTKFESITAEELDEIVPSVKTDSNGNAKPQLAKSSNDCSINLHEKDRYASKKLNGVRCLMRYDIDQEEIISISRGGKDYNSSTEHIRTHPELIELFQKYPDLILDGELYVHGWPLQKISGTCRLKTWEKRCEKLEYWVYDIADSSKTFEQRLDFLMFKLPDFINEAPVVIVEHKLVKSWDSVKKLHDKWVNEGFEGLVSRNPSKTYSFGKRNSDWIKVKDYIDMEFKVVGWEPGLRPVEDMVFVLETDNKKKFKAKPMGDKETKQEYIDTMSDLIGQWGTVKFFEWSTDQVPVQPTFVAFRSDDE